MMRGKFVRETERMSIMTVHACPLAHLGTDKAGGLNVYVREVAREFARRGVKVDVFTRVQEDCEEHIIIPPDEPFRLVHIPAGPGDHLSPNRIAAYLDEFEAGVERLAADEDMRYDLLFAHYWLSGVVACRLKKKWGVPTVAMFHTLAILKQQVAGEASEPEPQERIAGERFIMECADALIAPTERERDHMVRLYGADPAKIHVVPPGVDTRLFRPLPRRRARAMVGLRPGWRMILAVGRIEPIKGFETLIRAARVLLSRHGGLMRNTEIWIIGGDIDGDECVRLRALRKELGVGGVVKFMGPRKQKQLPEYYSAAEALVVPSEYESFSLVSLEAMACGTPVIGTPVGGLPQLVENGITGYLVPPHDPDVLADRIAEVLSANDETLESMRRATVRRAAPYAWPRTVDRLELVMSGLVRRRLQEV